MADTALRPAPAAQYGAVRTAAKFEAFVDTLLRDGKPIGFDIEASYSAPYYIDRGSLHQFEPSWFLVGFSFTNSRNWARYVPVAHLDGNNVDDPVRTARAVWRLLNSGLIVAHNVAYELKGCRRWFKDLLWDDPEVGEAVRAADGMFKPRSDTLLEVSLANCYEPKIADLTQKDLKGTVLLAFGHQMQKFDELFRIEGKKNIPKDKRFHLLDSTDPKVINYACEDSVWCLALHERHYPALQDDDIYKVEMALIRPIIEMEVEGMVLDWAEIHRRSEEIAAFRDAMNEEIQQDLSKRLGRPIAINLGSPQQLQEILYSPENLALPIRKRTDKGAASTDDKALSMVAKIDPTVRKILEWRQVAKLWSSYLHKYDTELNYVGNGRAYPNHNQVGTRTGRMSADHVSYQQWPKNYHFELDSGRTFDMNFRDLAIAPEGFRIVGFDFSQVELRVLAGMAQEDDLLAAFNAEQDVHKMTASKMLRIPLEQVTKKERARGKTLNFAIVYGQGADAIAEGLSTPEAPVSKDEAEKILADYFAGFPKLRAWIDARIAEGHESKEVFTPFGRRFTIWEYQDPRPYIRSKGDRMCVNAPVQGGAADYMKIGMVRVNRAIKRAGLWDKIHPVMVIHDALEFYVHESVSTQQVIDLIDPQVTFAAPPLPNIRADWHEGHRWGSVVEIKLDEHKQITHYQIEDDERKFDSMEAALAVMEEPKNSNPPQGPTQPGPPPNTTDEPNPTSPWEDNPKDSPQVDNPVDEFEPAPWDLPPTPHTWRVTVSEMPDEKQYERFKSYMKERPGTDTILLTMPEGEMTWHGTLSQEDNAHISLMLGGASLELVAGTVDAASVVADLDL